MLVYTRDDLARAERDYAEAKAEMDAITTRHVPMVLLERVAYAHHQIDLIRAKLAEQASKTAEKALP